MAGEKAKRMTIPAPVLGVNTKDPISEMEPLYAIDALNWFSNGQSCEIRKGFLRYSTPTFNVAQMYEYAMLTGTNFVITVRTSNGRLYSIDAGGIATDRSNAGARLATPPFTAVNFRGLVFAKDDGLNPVSSWDGAAANFVAAGFTGPGGADTLLRAPSVYRSRLYFCGMDLSIWHTHATDAITGVLDQFDMQSIFTRGGFLWFCGPLGRTGNLDNEYFCAISNKGEVLVYQGDSPLSATWGLVGHFYMPPPVGRSSFFYYGSNLAIITFQGIVLLNEVMKGDPNLTFVTDKINPSFVAELLDGLNPEYVSGVFSSKNNLLLINIYPQSGIPKQFVMNTLIQRDYPGSGWWIWQVTNSATQWCVYAGNLIFVSGITVNLFASGDYDVDASNVATTRTIRLRPAYNYFGDRSKMKQFTEARPILSQSEGLALTMDMDVDYANVTSTQVVSPDATDTAYKAYRPRVGLQAMGRAGSCRIDMTVTTKKFALHAIEVLWNEGGIEG